MDKNLANWQKELDDLQVDVELDVDKAADAFEEYKASFNEFVNTATSKIEGAMGENGTELKTKLEELQVQLALGKAESKDKVEEQRQKLSHTLHEVSTEYDKFKAEAGDSYEDFKEEMGDQLEKFKTRVDIFRLHFHLGMADSKDELENKRVVLKSQLHDIKTKMDEAEDKAEDKWDDFSEEMGKAFGSFRSALKKLID
ncbi:MAG: hypothetical protein AAFQ83_06695 [Bacteroidota bacterium]